MKSALEKVVFFECRIDQLAADLSRAQAEGERLRSDLSAAAEREVALRQQLAAAESRAGQAVRERDEAREQADAARAERERFLGRLIEAERIRQAGGEGQANDDGIDLAAFIAELRSEILALREAAGSTAGRLASPASHAVAAPATPAGTFSPPKPALPGAPTPAASPPPSSPPPRPAFSYASTEQAAEALADAGRIGINEGDRQSLQANARFGTRSEQTLFSLSLRELTSTDALSRLRAAQRLRTIGARAALPAVAAALNAEADPEVKQALLQAIAAAADPSALPLVQPHLGDPIAEVRLVALEAAFRLKDTGSLERGLADTCPRMRRRAAVLAAGEGNGAILETAIADRDPSVRRVAVLGLGAARGERASCALLRALDDPDRTVRLAAAKGLSRTHGPEVFSIAELDSMRRRREIRRLASTSTARDAAAGGPAASEAGPRVAAATSADAARALKAAVTARASAAAHAPADVAGRGARASASAESSDRTAPASPPSFGANGGTVSRSAPAARSSAAAAIAAVRSPAEPVALGENEGNLESLVLEKICAALRGQTPDELVRGAEAPAEWVLAAAGRLEKRGRVVRRGPRYFLA